RPPMSSLVPYTTLFRSLHDAKDAYSVRDERRRVLAKHGSLAEVEVAIPHKETDNLRIGMCGGYDLKQFEIARRVKEVCAAEVFAKIFAPIFQHARDWNARGVG